MANKLTNSSSLAQINKLAYSIKYINMIKSSLIGLICCLFFAIPFATNAQESALKLSTKVNANKSVDFVANKIDPGTYTVTLKFNNLSNASSGNEEVVTVKNYSANAFTLSPINKDQSIGFSYSYSYIRGKLNPKFDKEFLYLLPYKAGTKVRVAESGFVNAAYFGSTTPDDWKCYRFYTEQADSITAVRKGVVVNVKDLYHTDEVTDVAYTSKINEVTIEHPDGTLAYYRGFKHGIKAKVGQIVFPGTVLGVNSKYSTGTSYGISLLMTYLKDKGIDDAKTKTLKDSKSRYGFITPHFFTAEQTNLILEPQKYYTVASTTEIIQKELTKKEIKALGQ